MRIVISGVGETVSGLGMTVDGFDGVGFGETDEFFQPCLFPQGPVGTSQSSAVFERSAIAVEIEGRVAVEVSSVALEERGSKRRGGRGARDRRDA